MRILDSGDVDLGVINTFKDPEEDPDDYRVRQIWTNERNSGAPSTEGKSYWETEWETGKELLEK